MTSIVELAAVVARMDARLSDLSNAVGAHTNTLGHAIDLLKRLLEEATRPSDDGLSELLQKIVDLLEGIAGRPGGVTDANEPAADRVSSETADGIEGAVQKKRQKPVIKEEPFVGTIDARYRKKATC